MYYSIDHPGTGKYVCTNCYEPVYLENNYDKLPLCHECGNYRFIDG